jgi:hypothetical protein
MVRDYIHADVDHAVDFCGAKDGADFSALGSEACDDQVAAGNLAASGASYGSAEPGTDAEVGLVSDGEIALIIVSSSSST